MNSTQRFVSRTVFRRVAMPEFADKTGPVFEWFYTIRGINGEPLAGSQGEGYKELRGAVNGFFAAQGLPDWEPQHDEAAVFVIPENYNGYWLEVDNVYIIDHFAVVASPDTL